MLVTPKVQVYDQFKKQSRMEAELDYFDAHSY